MSDYCVVIVAAGTGQRMNHSQPKQFIRLNEVPVIVHTIRAFINFDADIQVIVVLGKDHFQEWEAVKKDYLSDIPLRTTTGGASRFQSVKNGLSIVKKAKYVAIHDAARPCIDTQTIRRTFEAAVQTGSGIPVVSLKDSIRSIAENTSKAERREHYVTVQTPQTFKLSLIREAYGAIEAASITDDASVYEYSGREVTLVEGNYRNIKLTTPDDLFIAGTYIKKAL